MRKVREVVAATGWQAHSVRGFLAGVVRMIDWSPLQGLSDLRLAAAPRHVEFLLARGRSPSPKPPLQLRITCIGRMELDNY